MKKEYIADKIREMPNSGIRKFFDLASTMEGILSLGVGEPDFETPWHVREAAIASIESGKTSYTSNQGMPELREAVAEFLKEKYDICYDGQTEVMMTVGASEGIDVALKALLNPGDEVLVVEPCFVSYKPCVVMAGGIPVSVPTTEENEFRPLPQVVEEKITPRTKAVILSFPNNPTGAILEYNDVQALASIFIKHDLVVISDEIYSELTYGTNHISLAALPGMWERTIILNGFSKAFAMTGWRLGYAAAPAPIIFQMNKIHQYIIMCASTMSQYAGLEALNGQTREEEIDCMREAYDERRTVMVEGFRKMGLDCFEPRGAFYVFPSIKRTGLTSEEFCEKLLTQEKIAVVPGSAFGESGEGFIRCSYAYSIDSIRLALEGIACFVKKYLK